MPLPVSFGQVRVRENSALHATEPRACSPGFCLPFPSGPGVGPSRDHYDSERTSRSPAFTRDCGVVAPRMESCTVETVMTVDGNLVTCDARRLLRYAFVRTHLRDDRTRCYRGGRRYKPRRSKRRTSAPITHRGSTADRWSIDRQLVFSRTPWIVRSHRSA